ncbi:hypothetical protein ACWDT6_02645 [Nocardia grenadensis]|uniref:hypothetical protein n=1 Tax=Nocardia grenadensis TaxID=931537 RepID=UPI003D725EBC
MSCCTPGSPAIYNGRRRELTDTAAGDGRLGWVDARDIASAASALLAGSAVELGDQRDYLLTGPKTLNSVY